MTLDDIIQQQERILAALKAEAEKPQEPLMRLSQIVGLGFSRREVKKLIREGRIQTYEGGKKMYLNEVKSALADEKPDRLHRTQLAELIRRGELADMGNGRWAIRQTHKIS